MCTVSYVPLKNGFCITSNRDEKVTRAKAIPPKEYSIKNKKITFPKDQKAGGTWFAQTKDAIIVLLNGADEKHIVKSSYRKSRGLIVLDLIITGDIIAGWHEIDLQNIEPFTIVLHYDNNLFQLRWNEIEKSQKILDTSKNYIWSSSTLYSKEIREERAKWFKDFLHNNENVSPKEMLDFHQFTKPNNNDFGLQINRNNILKTISITQTATLNKEPVMTYIDLVPNE